MIPEFELLATDEELGGVAVKFEIGLAGVEGFAHVEGDVLERRPRACSSWNWR